MSRVNWREDEFAAIYTSKALTINAKMRVNGRGPPVRPSHIVCVRI